MRSLLQESVRGNDEGFNAGQSGIDEIVIIIGHWEIKKFISVNKKTKGDE